MIMSDIESDSEDEKRIRRKVEQQSSIIMSTKSNHMKDEADVKSNVDQDDEMKEEATTVRPRTVQRTKRIKVEHEKCTVCFEPYTKQVRKKVQCPYCKAACCVDCSKLYLTSSVHDPHCMFCKIAWNADFLRHTFTNNWLTKEYSKIEVQSLWEREKSLLPRTMHRIEQEAFIKDFTDKNLYRLRARVNQLRTLLDRILNASFNSQNPEVNAAQLYACMQAVDLLNSKSQALVVLDVDREQMRTLFPNVRAATDTPVETKNKSTFTKPCPAPECRGFLSSQWMCVICKTKVCATCHAIKRLGDKNKQDADDSVDNDDVKNHKCKEEDIATATLIAKDSKNCPKCGVSIYKIEGCNQMFCTHCNTAFSWNTLTIINGNIHNPHYFAWLKSQGQNPSAQNPATFQCNNNDDFAATHVLVQVLNRYKINTRTTNYITDFIRSVNHIQQYGATQHRQTNDTTEDVNVNDELRYRYLKNVIDEETFKDLAYTRYKSKRFHRPKVAIVEMVHAAAVAIIRTIPLSTVYDPSIDFIGIINNVLTQMEELMNYYNQSMLDHHNLYKNDSRFIVFYFTSNSYYRSISFQEINRKTHIEKLSLRRE